MRVRRGLKLTHGDAFRGQRYAAFRNYNRQWHDRGWWRSHYTRIIFVNSGWWYWNAGYWFPAWGYAPYVSYVYDGPIYAYNGLSPDQVTVNVQQQLAAAGYYDGPIDGILGPMTREAIASHACTCRCLVRRQTDSFTNGRINSKSTHQTSRNGCEATAGLSNVEHQKSAALPLPN